MEEYNQLIASHVLDGVERGIIKSTPQPTMFGGKRMRKWVLPGSTDYDYPGTLSVGSLDGSRSDTIGGSFWKDFGHGFKQGFTGTAKALAPIAVPIAKELLLAKMRGAGYDSSSDDDMEGGMIVGADGHGIRHGAQTMPEVGVSRADGGMMRQRATGLFRQKGGARDKDPVREYMKQIGSVINPALLVGLGMPGADGHGVRKIGGASPAEKLIGATNPLLWGYDLGKDVIAPAMMKVIPPRKKGRGRLVKGSAEAKAYMASIRAKKMEGGAYKPTGRSKPAGFVRRMVAVDQGDDEEEKEKLEKYRPFDLSAIKDQETPFLSPSQNLRSTYAKKKKGRPQKHASAEEAYKAKLESNKRKRAEKRAMAKAQKEGGAMIMNHPGEFHSASYPPALASYKHQMAVGGKKGSFLSDLGKAVAPVAKDVFVPLAKEMATDYIRGKARGGKKGSFLSDLGKAVAPVAKDVFVPLAKEAGKEYIRNKMKGGKKGNSFIKGFAKVVSPVAKVVGEEIVVPLAKEAIRNKMKGGARSARNEIVKKVMAEMGLSLPMASKYVKEQGLY
jgi:hypothetical protein